MRFRVIAFFVVGVFYLAVPNARPDFTQFNCNDSEAYLTLAWNLAHGRGYTRSMVNDIYLPHTTWPPGTAALMVPAAALSGRTINWFAVKWTMCLVGLTGIALAWFYLRAVTGKPLIADLGALLLGLNPLYWDFSHQAMAEIPLTVSCIGGLYLVDRIWNERRVRSYEALGAGLICGLSMLLKGHAAGLALAPLAYLAGHKRSALRASLGMYLLFTLAFAVPQLCWMARNRTVPATGFEGINRFRSVLAVDPNDADSPLVGSAEFGARVVKNVRYYAVYRLPEQIIPGFWPEAVWNWRGSGVCALLLSGILLTMTCRLKYRALPICFVAFPMIALNLAYGFGGAARFWVPITSLLTLAVAAGLGSAVSRRWYTVSVCAALLFLNLAVYVVQHERHPYNHTTAAWQELAELFEAISHEKGISPVGVLTQNQDAFQLMTGFRAPWGKNDLTYDYIVVDLRSSALPPGSRVVVSRPPWVFASLARAMSRDAIATAQGGRPR